MERLTNSWELFVSTLFRRLFFSPITVPVFVTFFKPCESSLMGRTRKRGQFDESSDFGHVGVADREPTSTTQVSTCLVTPPLSSIQLFCAC